ncbi:MAG: hypothetical protein IAG13_37265 [Deltaproteobacteria bacterium]|nr:hypothetical protein [Nannocystaceae bacterium]
MRSLRSSVALLLLVACGSSSNDDGSDGATGSSSSTDPITASTTMTSTSATTSPMSSSESSSSEGGSTAPAEGSSSEGSSSSGGEDPIDFAGEMNGYRWELPCADPSLRDTCAWDPALLEGAIDDPMYTLHREDAIVFGGDPSVVYDVEIRIRGLSEPKDFSGGEVQADHFQIGGTPGTNDYNIYSITVGEPAQVYTVNRNAMGTGHYTFVMDYTVTIPIHGGTMVTMTMIDPNDQAIANPGGSSGSVDPFVVPEIPPFPDAFFGQFIQMDVLSVAPQT